MNSIKNFALTLLSHLVEVLLELTPKQLTALLSGIALFGLSLLFAWITYSAGPGYFPMWDYRKIALGLLIFSVVCLGLLFWKIKWYRAEVRRLREEELH